MKSDARPRITPGRTRADSVLEMAAVATVLAMWVYAVTSYRALPAQIPVHFNFAGEPDRWGGKWSVFLLPSVAVAVHLVMTVAGVMRPWYWNIPAVVTEENAARVYGATARLLRVVKLEAVAMMGLLLVLVVQSARDGRAWGVWAPLVAAGTIMTSVMAGMIAIRRAARARSGGTTEGRSEA